MKNFKMIFLGIIIGGILFGTIGIYAGGLLKADEIRFSSSDANWNVENVKLALDDLYDNSYIATGNTIVAGSWYGYKHTSFTNIFNASTPVNSKYLVYDNENGNYRVKKAGKYLVKGFLHVASTTEASGPTCTAYANDAVLFSTSKINDYPTSETELNEGDTISIKCKNNGKHWNIFAWNINYVN